MLTSKKNLFADYGTSKQPVLTELEKLEEVIGRGKQSFIEVGEALAQVRDKKLYLGKYDTFAEYCERRWNFKKSYVYDLMNASEEVLKLPEPERPKTERGARKVLKIRRTSAMADIHTNRKDVIKTKEIEVEMTTPNDQGRQFAMTDRKLATAIWNDVLARVMANKSNPGFVKALDEWLKESGL